MRIASFALILAVCLSGCQSYLSLIDGLNERGVESCLDYNGSARVGSFLAGGSGALHGITVTGGATLEDCVNLLRR